MHHFVTQKIFSNFFVFSHFGSAIWTWVTFDFVIRIWWVWDTSGMIPKNDFGFNKFNPSHWGHHHLVPFWYWNLGMNSSWESINGRFWRSEVFLVKNAARRLYFAKIWPLTQVLNTSKITRYLKYLRIELIHRKYHASLSTCADSQYNVKIGAAKTCWHQH